MRVAAAAGTMPSTLASDAFTTRERRVRRVRSSASSGSRNHATATVATAASSEREVVRFDATNGAS
ncbi:MAG TPA: hypothetical protein VFG37_02465, partial [Planctomycetota bacterium]|nr:hypothetical protein [Planctomycetota bacterium]